MGDGKKPFSSARKKRSVVVINRRYCSFQMERLTDDLLPNFCSFPPTQTSSSGTWMHITDDYTRSSHKQTPHQRFAMEENSSPPRESQESGSPSCPARILDRKIERHGLGQSFSSNLARRGPSSGRKPSDRSVRDMVGLFEKSTGIPTSDSPRYTRPTLESDLEKDRRGGHDGNNITLALRDQHRPGQAHTTTPSMLPSARVGYQVEDYSLTLLKHKSYFNNRPLARCLDENQEQDKRPKIQRVQSKKERAREPATGDRQDGRYGNGEGQKENKDIAPSTRNQTPTSIQQLDTLMGELLVWQGKISESTSPELDQQRENRSRGGIESFWRSVRAHLGVDDDEIYGETPRQAAPGQRGNEPEEGREGLDLKLSTSAAALPASSHSDREPEHPLPPMPTRPPPPIPTVPRGRSLSAASSQRTEHPITPSWEPLPGPARDSSIRLSISAPVSLDLAELLCYAQRELPALPEPARPPPATPTEPSHSRRPSGSSGHWIRPPTWRSPSSLRSSSPPPVPALPVPVPTPAPTPAPHHRPNHSRHRHQQRPSKTSTSTATSTSTHSLAVTDSSGSRSMHSRRTAKTSTSSTATRADSSTDLSAATAHLPSKAAPHRRLTTEKLEEIDAFLSPGQRQGGGEGWI